MIKRRPTRLSGVWEVNVDSWRRSFDVWLTIAFVDFSISCLQHSHKCNVIFPSPVSSAQALATGSTLTAVGTFQLPAPQSGTLCQILSGTRPSVQTVSDVCLKRICLLDTSAFSALEVPYSVAACYVVAFVNYQIKSVLLLLLLLTVLYKSTYLLICLFWHAPAELPYIAFFAANHAATH